EKLSSFEPLRNPVSKKLEPFSSLEHRLQFLDLLKTYQPNFSEVDLLKEILSLSMGHRFLSGLFSRSFTPMLKGVFLEGDRKPEKQTELENWFRGFVKSRIFMDDNLLSEVLFYDNLEIRNLLNDEKYSFASRNKLFLFLKNL